MTHGASATRFNDYDIEGFGVPEDFIADVIDQIIMTDPSTGILEQLTVRNSLRSSVNQFYATADYMSPFSYVAQPGDVSDASVSGFARHLVDTNTGKFISRTYVQFRTTSVSSEVLQSAVPEPATWATMLLGFGLIGGGMRYRRRQRVRVTYA
ncbi:MAG: PEPxxWA-CTERM sorting domain-containing protein [Sphingopyxis sp.]|nr:PEPxxWA-CTERM sorting domain-containing protein [Sphingopyxis sp.]